MIDTFQLQDETSITRFYTEGEQPEADQISKIHETAELIAKNPTSIILIEPDAKDLNDWEQKFNRAQLADTLAFLINPLKQWNNVTQISVFSDNEKLLCDALLYRLSEWQKNVKFVRNQIGHNVQAISLAREAHRAINLTFKNKPHGGKDQLTPEILFLGIENDPNLELTAISCASEYPQQQTQEFNLLELHGYINPNKTKPENRWSFPNPSFPIFGQDSRRNPLLPSVPLE